MTCLQFRKQKGTEPQTLGTISVLCLNDKHSNNEREAFPYFLMGNIRDGGGIDTY